MAKFAVFVVAVLAFHAALAAPKKTQSQNQGGASKNQLEEVVNQVEAVVSDVTNTLQKALPDEKQVTEVVAQKSQQLVKDVEGIIKKLQTEIDKNKGSSDALLQQITTQVTENINALKQAIGPDAVAKANDLKAQVNTQIKNTATNLEQLKDITKNSFDQTKEALGNFAQEILTDFVKVAEDFKTQVDNAIETAPKTLKQKH